MAIFMSRDLYISYGYMQATIILKFGEVNFDIHMHLQMML